jgi:hypothetical protein
LSSGFSLARAGRWLLDSGIQEKSGGVARFYQADIRKNKPVSTEITGYFASAMVWLFDLTGDEEYLDRARLTAGFLVNCAWEAELRTFPFEHPSPSPESGHHTYFFDCGIIVRGLIAVWRRTQDERLLDIAIAAGRAMIADFHSGDDYHPILELPAKRPLDRVARWSRMPGCYQLKAALGWWELAAVTGDDAFESAFLEMVYWTLRSREGYLPGSSAPHEVMDRLHSWCYFLEGLTPVAGRPDCHQAYVDGICASGLHLKKIESSFVRSDVYAQLLRARLRTAEIDCQSAAREAEAMAQFQAVSDDPRIDGGFFFGRRNGALSPHVNPVSTIFSIQANEMWRQHQLSEQAGEKPPCLQMPI